MTAETSNAREWVDLLERAVPFLLDEGAKYDDDGSNEPLELAREIETLLASLPSDESALSSASSAFDGGREAATPPPPAAARGELRMTDIREDAREPLQLLREKLVRDEDGWAALCELMPMLAAAPPPAADGVQAGEVSAYDLAVLDDAAETLDRIGEGSAGLREARARIASALSQQPAPQSAPEYPITATCRACDYDYRCVPVPAKCGACGSDLPPSAPVGAAEDMVLDAIDRRESSAPVGVEAIAAEIRASLGRGATVCTRRRWAIELEALAQQPAAVDEAMVERAAAAVMSAPPGISVEAYVRIVLEAAIATQHQEPKS